MAATGRSDRRIRLTRRSGYDSGRLLGAPALVLFICLLLLFEAIGVKPVTRFPSHLVKIPADPHIYVALPATATPTAKARPSPTPTAKARPSPTATSTVAARPPTIQMVSPTSRQGPVGARVTVTGTNFTGSEAHLFGSTGADCGASSGTLTSTTVSGGNIRVTFVWPVSFPTGTYYICASGMTNSTATYVVLTSSPPALRLSTSSVQMSQSLTIQGVNFAGAAAGSPVTLTETTANSGAGSRTLPVSATVDGNGGFNASWTVDGPYTGPVTIKAYAEFEGTAPAVLQASVAMTIQAAATATVKVSASASASVSTGIPNTSTPGSSTGATLLIIVLVVGIIITLLVIVGIVIFLTLHRRDVSRYSGPGQGTAPGYAAYGEYRDYGQFSMLPEGQVAEWDNDPDSQPGPNWRPRPMTGYPPRYNIGQEPPDSVSGWSQPQRMPVDPWSDPEESTLDPANDQWHDPGDNRGGGGGAFWP